LNEDNNLQNKQTGDNIHKAPLAFMHPALFVLVVLVTVFFTYQVLGGAVSYFLFGADLKSGGFSTTLARIVISFSQFMFILAPVFLLSLLQGNKTKETFRLKKPDMRIFSLSIAGIIVVQPALQAFIYIQNKLLFSIPFGSEYIRQLKQIMDSLEAVMLTLVTSHSIPEFLFVLFVVALTPAICEEFLFRGLIFRNFGKILPAGKSIFLTGLLFAVFHFHPFNLIPLIVLGVYLTFTVYYSDSIYTAVSVHFINNFISAAFVFFAGKEGFDNPESPVSENAGLLIYGMVSALLFTAVIFAIKKFSGNKKTLPGL
jgi:membrane protease YdiL (CAAX protease family)